MKRLIIISIFLVSSIGVFAQWTQLNSGTNNQLQEVYFLNEDTGFVVGMGDIYNTTDGGSTWTTSHTGFYGLMGLYFSNDTSGYAVGIDGFSNQSVVITTTDGGSNWTPATLPATTLSDVFFLDSDTGFTVGSGGVAYRTTNAGSSWDSLSTGTTDILNGVYFTDSQNGIAVGGSVAAPLILKTTDGGNNWNTITSPATDFLQSVFFPSSLLGYIVGWNGEILKTTDGGSNWTVQTPASVYGNIDVYFTDTLTGYIVGGSTSFTGVQKTIDGGQNWFSQTSNCSNGMVGVNFPSDTVGYAVGENGAIIKTTNGGGTGIPNQQLFTMEAEAYPNPFVSHITIGLHNFRDDVRITVFDLNGKKVFQRVSSQNKEVINLSTLNRGIYFLVLETENGGKVVKKITKS